MRLWLPSGIIGALTATSVGLKLGGVIHWPWVWVTLPFWFVPAVGAAAVFLVLTLGLCVALVGTAAGAVAYLVKK